MVLQSRVCSGGCGIGVGGNCAIAATVLWFFAGIFSCGAGKDAAEAAEAQKEKEEAEEEEAGAAATNPVAEAMVENEEKA